MSPAFASHPMGAQDRTSPSSLAFIAACSVMDGVEQNEGLDNFDLLTPSATAGVGMVVSSEKCGGAVARDVVSSESYPLRYLFPHRKAVGVVTILRVARA